MIRREALAAAAVLLAAGLGAAVAVLVPPLLDPAPAAEETAGLAEALRAGDGSPAVLPFPVFQVPFLGNGMVIGTVGVVHIALSHGLAIGAWSLLVLAIHLGAGGGAEEAADWDRFQGRLLHVLVLGITIAGAVTGAGIWFSIGALAPRAVGLMLRVFFWPWFVEWLVFVAEVAVILLVWRSWSRWTGPRRHLRLIAGWGYLGLAMVSAVLITGILGFMLTPGRWPAEGGFWRAFLNPSFVPQLVTRLALSTVLGGIVVLAVARSAGLGDAARRRASRLAGVALLGGLPVLAASAAVWLAVVPPLYTERSMFAVLTSHLSHSPAILVGANLLAASLLLALGLAAVARRRGAPGWLLLAGALAGLGVTAEIERVREFIRGPYLIPGHLYVSSVLLREAPALERGGLLAAAAWQPLPGAGSSEDVLGAALFSRACAACHTIGGVNGIERKVAGRSEDGIAVLIAHTSEMVSFMPPFTGTADERHLLARFLARTARGEVRWASRARHLPSAEAP